MKRKNHPGGPLKNYMHWPLMLTVLLVLMNAPLYYFDRTAGICVSVFAALYFLIALGIFLVNRSAMRNEVISFATQYGTVQKKLLNEFEIPYALLDYNSKILWMNEAFSRITEKDKGYHKSIATIFPSITRELLDREEHNDHIKVEWKNRVYRASVGKIHFDGEESEGNLIETDNKEQFLTTLYLFDETELYESIQEIRDQQLVAMLIYIDNYEEALESVEEVKRSLLVALVDRKVSKYFSDRDSIIKKIEKDKYFVAFKQKYLEALIENKFSILEDVKTVKVGNEMAVTLSIGVGISGNSYTQKYEYARMAIDLALGRGGDQVVVKEGEKISYFGGKSRQVEKMTRVKARVKAHALREIIESREEVFIMGHSISDMDAFGASIGIYCAAFQSLHCSVCDGQTLRWSLSWSAIPGIPYNWAGWYPLPPPRSGNRPVPAPAHSAKTYRPDIPSPRKNIPSWAAGRRSLHPVQYGPSSQAPGPHSKCLWMLRRRPCR